MLRLLAMGLIYSLACDGGEMRADTSIDRPDTAFADGGADGSIDAMVDGMVDGTAADVTIPPDDGLAPRIFDFRVRDGENDRVYFESDKPLRGSDAAGFTISGRTIEDVVTAPEAVSGHYFVLTEPFDFWDNNTVRYDGGSDLRDTADRPLDPFVMEYIQNQIVEPTSAVERYVTVDASGGGDGTSESSAWTLEEAFETAAAGTTVWIKAGNYGDLTLSFPSGTADDPIKFIGYKDSIGDITDIYYSYGDGELDPSEMPLLDGSGSGVAMSGGFPSYVIVRNIQARNYEIGFYSNNGTGMIFDGCIVKDGTGDFGGALIHGEASSRARTLNCIAINGTGGNCSISGNNNLIRNVRSYSDNTSNPTDYYFGIAGSNHITIDTYAYRTPGLSHSGHGMSVQTPAPISDEIDPERTEYNLIIGHTAVNMAKGIEFRHGGVRHNVGRNLYFHGEEANGLLFRDNASFNIVENSRFDVPNGYAVAFIESVEIGVGLGHDNIVRNSVGDADIGVYFDIAPGSVATCNNNKIYNNTFLNASVLLYRDSGDYTFEGNEFINNIVVNVATLANSDVSGWTYENSDFFGGFDAPDGVGNVSIDPGFVSASDVHLTASSPTEVTEGARSLPEVKTDADGNKRSTPYSMGAYEY